MITEEARMKAYLDDNRTNSTFKKNKKSVRFYKYYKKNDHLKESYYKKYPELIPDNSEQEKDQTLIVL